MGGEREGRGREGGYGSFRYTHGGVTDKGEGEPPLPRSLTFETRGVSLLYLVLSYGSWYVHFTAVPIATATRAAVQGSTVLFSGCDPCSFRDCDLYIE